MSYQHILNEIVDKSKRIFQEHLTGVYLHGSLAMGCFNPQKSDIDVIIVTNSSITDIQKLQFMDHIVALHKNAPGKGIELSIVGGNTANTFFTPHHLNCIFQMHICSGLLTIQLIISVR